MANDRVTQFKARRAQLERPAPHPSPLDATTTPTAAALAHFGGLAPSVQPEEVIVQVDDTQLLDSPYQARVTYDPDDLAALAQGMQQSGFQGVLLARPHPDVARRRSGAYQLVYGHRRRLAWRQACDARGVACVIPVVVRDLADAEVLTIGAQENLQRADLSPLEEAQLVAWHIQLYPELNQAEIGRMLGKSEGWVRLRLRLHRLPAALKERVTARPQSATVVVELASLYERDAAAAIALADRIVDEGLTLTELRTLLTAYRSPAPPEDREETHNSAVNSGIVQKSTNPPSSSVRSSQGQSAPRQHPQPSAAHAESALHAPQVASFLHQLAQVRLLAWEIDALPDLAQSTQLAALHQGIAETLDVLLPLMARLSPTKD